MTAVITIIIVSLIFTGLLGFPFSRVFAISLGAVIGVGLSQLVISAASKKGR